MVVICQLHTVADSGCLNGRAEKNKKGTAVCGVVYGTVLHFSTKGHQLVHWIKFCPS